MSVLPISCALCRAPFRPQRGGRTICGLCESAEAELARDRNRRKPSGDVPAWRRCLTCRERFWSSGFGNRICRGCAPAVNRNAASLEGGA